LHCGGGSMAEQSSPELEEGGGGYVPVMRLGQAIYRPGMGKMSTRRSSRISLTGKGVKPVAVVASQRRPAMWRAGEVLGRRGARHWR